MQIRPSEYLNNGFSLMKTNYRALFLPAFLNSLMFFLLGALTLVFSTNTPLMIGLGLVGLIALYLSCKLTICEALTIQNIRMQRPTDFKNTYILSEIYTPQYIGIYILYFLMISPVLFALGLTFRSVPITTFAPVIMFLTLPLLQFAPLSVVFDSSRDKRFRFSFNLVKKHLPAVYILFFMSITIFKIPDVLFSVVFPHPGIILSHISNLISCLIYLISMPFALCIQIPLFFKLKEFLEPNPIDTPDFEQ